LRIGGFRVYVLNSGLAPATGVYVDVVAWRPGAPGPDVERSYTIRDLAPNADFTFDVSFRNPHLDPKYKDTLPTGGYLTVSSANAARPRAWAFHVPNNDDHDTRRQFFTIDPWPLAEFSYPSGKPKMGSCVNYPSGVCRDSSWTWNPPSGEGRPR
jgi:hypothetical protein